MAKAKVKNSDNATNQTIIQLLIESNSLKFGKFITKSNKISPYYINTGMIYFGDFWTKFISLYINKIKSCYDKHQVLGVFGSAYKGIPLVSSFSEHWYQHTGISIPFCFDRKEQKTHGEQKKHLGVLEDCFFDKNQKNNKNNHIKSGFIVLDDVLSSGISLHQAFDYLNDHKIKILAACTAINRNEYLSRVLKSQSCDKLTAKQALYKKHNIDIHYLISFKDIYHYFNNDLNNFLTNIKNSIHQSTNLKQQKTNHNLEKKIKLYQQALNQFVKQKSHIDDYINENCTFNL